MKTTYLKTDWMAPLVGIALVVGTVAATKAYLGFERKTVAEQAFAVTLDRLYNDHELGAALRRIHDGDVKAAAQRLDVLLCDHIVQANSGLASADQRTRAHVEDAFRRIARQRPNIAEVEAAGSGWGRGEDQVQAERILAYAAKTPETAQVQ